MIDTFPLYPKIGKERKIGNKGELNIVYKINSMSVLYLDLETLIRISSRPAKETFG